MAEDLPKIDRKRLRAQLQGHQAEVMIALNSTGEKVLVGITDGEWECPGVNGDAADEELRKPESVSSGGRSLLTSKFQARAIRRSRPVSWGALKGSHQQLQAMCRFVEQAAEERQRVDEVERELFTQLLAVGQTLLRAFVDSQGDGDVGAELEEGDRRLRRLNDSRTRRYLSIFGELLISRRVYTCREGQKIERVPLDERLGLPAGEFSYVLEDWQQRLCVKESFAEAVTSLRTLLGVAPIGRAAEQMNQRMAQDAEAFQLQLAPPPDDEEGEILVATADGKGVPMRRPVPEPVHNSHPRRGKGEKANKKKMAYVGAVYSIDRFVRTADDVLDEICRRERAADRPQPQHKQLWAEMTRVTAEESSPGRERVFIEMAVACHHRDPQREKTLVCLMDGEKALWEMAGGWLPRAVGILDLFHVLERLWQAAYCFHPERSPEAEAFVSHRLRMLLAGKVGYVIGVLRRLHDQQFLTTAKRKTLNAVITYYENNRQHMRYDEYLAQGYPIGSGVAEGACRHLVKDRMEGTGMRWTVHGAQAMLHLRAIYLNGDWKAYMNYRIETEQARLYPCSAA